MKKTSKMYQIPQNPYEYTLEEISLILGISKERTRQLERQAIKPNLVTICCDTIQSF